MSNKLARIFAIFVTVCILFSLPRTVKAAENTCVVTASPLIGSVPLNVNVQVKGVEGITTIEFGDGNVEVDNNSTHQYVAVSRFRITAVVNGVDGKLYRCHAYIQTKSSENIVETEEKSITNLPMVLDIENTSIDEMRDGNVSPIITNNSGEINITVEQDKDSNQPIVITPEPVVRQKADGFLPGLIHAFLEAIESYIKALDESWYPSIEVQPE